MAGTSNEAKLSLKIMVDMKAKKVVFAEASKEFVDFIFNLLSMPLSAVTEAMLIDEKDVAGSLGSIYKSIESLDAQCLEPNVNTDSLLNPKVSGFSPFFWLDNGRAPICRRYICNSCYKIDKVSNVCTCGMIMETVSVPGYVKGGAVYMVMDNLEVKPLSMSLIKAHVRDFYELEEKHVQVGFHEGSAIMKASLETKNVLTRVFLEKI